MNTAPFRPFLELGLQSGTASIWGREAWLVQLHRQAGKKGKIKQMALSEDCDWSSVLGLGIFGADTDECQSSFLNRQKTNEQKARKQRSATSPTIKSSWAALSSPNIKNKWASGDYLWNQNGPAVGSLPWETGCDGFISCSVCIARSRASQHMCTAVDVSINTRGESRSDASETESKGLLGAKHSRELKLGPMVSRTEVWLTRLARYKKTLLRVEHKIWLKNYGNLIASKILAIIILEVTI